MEWNITSKSLKIAQGKFNLPEQAWDLRTVRVYVKLHKKHPKVRWKTRIRVNCIYLNKAVFWQMCKNDYLTKKGVVDNLFAAPKRGEKAVYYVVFSAWHFGNLMIKYHYIYKANGFCGSFMPLWRFVFTLFIKRWLIFRHLLLRCRMPTADTLE